jgi:hypothetical protein
MRTRVIAAAKWRQSGCNERKFYGAHRLPAGKTAAERRERGRPAGQAAKIFKDRLLQVSKASAPFVKTFKF